MPIRFWLFEPMQKKTSWSTYISFTVYHSWIMRSFNFHQLSSTFINFHQFSSTSLPFCWGITQAMASHCTKSPVFQHRVTDGHRLQLVQGKARKHLAARTVEGDGVWSSEGTRKGDPMVIDLRRIWFESPLNHH